jgi:Restriction endonuclease BpuJI - N terminal/Domain of unknown function (DUF3883)
MNYKIPAKRYYRIHHVRPRFKNNVESVLLYIATIVADLGSADNSLFKEIMLKKIKEFPGNANLSLKTLQNWRTEISALFSLYHEDDEQTHASALAYDLRNDQDLTKFFKYFLYSFQYPGAHIKTKEIRSLISEGICFKPAKYFLKVIFFLESIEKSQAYLTKGEACHMIFNDKRATCDRDLDNAFEIAKEIIANRKAKVKYDLSGDVIRYAGDILDYMVLANLLRDYAGKFYVSKNEKRSIDKFLTNDEYFEIDDDDLRYPLQLEEDWVAFVSKSVSEKMFSTDVLAFIARDEKEYEELQKRTNYIQAAEVPGTESRTKDIGDYGENVVYGHECTFLKMNKRDDLIHLVKCIPNHFAAGYDIQSVHVDEIKKYIEVKTTISSKKLTFNKFHLTRNELGTAQSLKENYYVYRLQVIKGDQAEDEPILNLRVIRDPISLYKRELIDIDIPTGEVTLRKFFGDEVKVLKWS